jgi:glycosyltransferase involved in cell wall biosynthesis
MSTIELSFIIPAYNCEKYIENCINSLLNQDIPTDRYELIIVNDGSTDNTASILKRISNDRKNILLINQNNKGRHEARNIGASVAKGRYIWFIDNDDEISANCLTSVLQIANNNSLDVLVVAPPAKFMPVYTKTEISETITGKEFIRNGVSYWAPWQFLIKRDFYINNNFKFKLRYFLEDIELLYRVFYRAESLAFLKDKSCYNYLTRPESETSKPWNLNKLMDFANYINLTEDFINNDVIENDIKLIFERNRMSFYLALLNNWKTIRKEVKLSYLLSLIKSKPTSVYGNIFSQIYQRIAIYFPYLFIRLKQ